jgi:hypothetical protein
MSDFISQNVQAAPDRDVICAVCKIDIYHPEFEGSVVCPNCSRGLPGSLVKACQDPFDYALKLRTGEVVRFVEAEIDGAWVTLIGNGNGKPNICEGVAGLDYHCPRGVDVRISDIVWCADAPEGS